MRSEQDIVFGLYDQKLILTVPEGRPDAVLGVSVFAQSAGDDTAPEDALFSVGIVEAQPNTVTDGSAGIAQANQKIIPLVSTAGIVRGRRYLLSDIAGGAHGGHREWVEPVSIATDDTVTIRHRLENDYAPGATFQSTRVEALIASAFVADENNISDDTDPNPGYRVRWHYSVNCIQYVRDTYFDLVRYAGAHDVQPGDVFETMPVLKESMHTDHRADAMHALIDRAYHEVRVDLQTMGKADEMIRNRAIMNNLVTWKTILLWAINEHLTSGDDDGRVDRVETMYQAKLDKLIQVGETVDFAVSEDGSGGPVSSTPLWKGR